MTVKVLPQIFGFQFPFFSFRCLPFATFAPWPWLATSRSFTWILPPVVWAFTSLLQRPWKKLCYALSLSAAHDGWNHQTSGLLISKGIDKPSLRQYPRRTVWTLISFIFIP
jgi:hypothetical protein